MSRKQKRPGAETAALFMGLLNLLARSEGIQPNLETMRGLLDLLDRAGNQQPQPDVALFSGVLEKQE